MIGPQRRSAPLAIVLLAALLAACGGGGGKAPADDRGADPYAFSREPLAAYRQVDRMGAPVVATVLLPTSQKDNFNEGNPEDDGDFAPFVVKSLAQLHFELDDDLIALDMTPCAVDICTRQAVPKIVPDVLRLRLDQPDGFPNGRRLQDSVVDRILAIALLDLSTPGDCRGEPCAFDSFVRLPLNPPANDAAFLADFPYLAPPQS
jgi:hypothetical protein